MTQIISRTFYVIIFFINSNLFAQDNSISEIDSLNQVIKNNILKDYEKADLFLEISKIYIYKNLDSAEVYAQKGMGLSIKSNHERGKAVYYIRKCKIAELSQNMDKAIEFGNKSIELYSNISKDRNYLVILNIQAYLYEKQSIIDKGLELYLTGLKEAKFQKNELFEAVFYNNLSGIYSIIGELDQSIEFNLKAIEKYKKLGYRMYYGSALLNIGNKYLKKEQYDLALKFLRDARVISLEMNDFSALQKIELNLGIIEYEKKNYKETLNHYQKGLEFAEQLNDLDDYKASSVACMQENIGGIYKDLNRYDEAINIYRKAIDYAEKNKSKHILGHAYYDLFEIYKTLNKPDSAFYYIQKYLPINDSIHKETQNKQIEELNFKSKLENEKLKHIQEKKLIIVEKRKDQLNLIVIISVLTLMVLVILFFWYSKKTKLVKSELRRQNLNLEKENLNLDLEKSNKELSTTLLNLIERNEFIANISEKLAQINSVGNLEDRKNVQTILRDIDKNSSKKLWKEFELSYIEVHKEFFERLNSKYPSLTSNERRLCAFVILNMSTKDISSITYQSTQSIKIARYRLRKKLEINKNDNLSSFLNAI